MVRLDPRQLTLALEPKRGPFTFPTTEREAQQLRIGGYLSLRLPDPVEVVLTNNRSTMISYKRARGRLIVRLHAMFQSADQQTLDTLVSFIRTRDAQASKALNLFITDHHQEVTPAKKRTNAKPMFTAGQHHDLSAVLRKLSQTYFGGELNLHICWSRTPIKRPRRRGRTVSRALATYSFGDQTIRVSQILDQRTVPEYVLEWVVYHEMLHHIVPVERAGTTKRYHTKRFRLLERAYARYAEAKAWEEAHLDQLLH